MKNENSSKFVAKFVAQFPDRLAERFTVEAGVDAPLPVFRHAYHEIGGHHHVVETNGLEQLKANISQLDDLHGRLTFMMAELSSLIRKA